MWQAPSPWRGAVAGAIALAVSAAAIAEPGTLTFDATCAAGDRVVIAAVGDLLFHDALQAQALRPGRDFQAFFQPVLPILLGSDLTYGNLEGPLAAGVRPGGMATRDPGRRLDGIVYGRTGDALIFNYHPSLALDLKAVGFSVVSTANNHAADRGPLGIERTIEALATADLAYSGTRKRGNTNARWSTITRANGFAVAWLACTFDLNGMPDPSGQVLNCYADSSMPLLAEVRRLAADRTIDAIIVTPHWGTEGSPTPRPADRKLARDLIEAGASAIIATHPHRLQPWEKIRARNGREGLVVYSTGNFISNQDLPDQRTGVIALLEISRPAGERARLTAAGFVPTYVEMSNERDHRVTPLSDDDLAGASPRATALASVLERLPTGNRVSPATFRNLPRTCAQRIAPTPVATPAVPAAVAQTTVAAKPADAIRRPGLFDWVAGFLRR